jgi:hypothetical protein
MVSPITGANPQAKSLSCNGVSLKARIYFVGAGPRGCETAGAGGSWLTLSAAQFPAMNLKMHGIGWQILFAPSPLSGESEERVGERLHVPLQETISTMPAGVPEH